jgi:hypothetical protein
MDNHLGWQIRLIGLRAAVKLFRQRSAMVWAREEELGAARGGGATDNRISIKALIFMNLLDHAVSRRPTTHACDGGKTPNVQIFE